jgi:hypothetical protein
MPQGLLNASSTFQRFINSVLHGLTPLQTCVFVDDTIVFGRTFEQTLEILSNVFERLNNNHLTLSLEKCQFFCGKSSLLRS